MSHHERVWFRRRVRQLRGALLDLVLPPICAACGEPARELCDVCVRQLVPRPRLGCLRCGEPVVVAARCDDDHRDLTGLAALVAPWRYVGTGGALVRRFKLDGDVGAGRLLARAMANALRQAAPSGFARAVVVPVPLHRERRRQRGFDQSAWLAREVARRVGLRVGVDVLRRVRATVPQGDPRVMSRERNVAGAFAVARNASAAGRACLLVDDVFTSGATGRECARVLRAAGFGAVAMLTACRS